MSDEPTIITRELLKAKILIHTCHLVLACRYIPEMTINLEDKVYTHGLTCHDFSPGELL